MARGLEKRVLDDVNEWPLTGSGCGSFWRGPLHWIHGWGLPMGSIPTAAHWWWAGLMGRRFWGGCWFSSLGGRGRGRGTPGRVMQRRWDDVSQDDASSEQPLCVCYILYVGQWKFHCNMSSGHREGGPRSSIALGRHVYCSTSTARRPSPHIEDGEGVVAPRSATDSTEQWVWFSCTCSLCCYLLCVYYMYMSVICSYMLYVCEMLCVCYVICLV